MLLPRGGSETQNPFMQKIAHTFGWDQVDEKAVEVEETIAMPTITWTLQKGSKGEAVTAIQKRLKQLGYFEGEVSETFDDATTIAVKAFQKDNKLTADGVVGDKTLKKIFDPEAKHAGEKAGVFFNSPCREIENRQGRGRQKERRQEGGKAGSRTRHGIPEHRLVPLADRHGQRGIRPQDAGRQEKRTSGPRPEVYRSRWPAGL